MEALMGTFLAAAQVGLDRAPKLIGKRAMHAPANVRGDRLREDRRVIPEPEEVSGPARIDGVDIRASRSDVMRFDDASLLELAKHGRDVVGRSGRVAVEPAKHARYELRLDRSSSHREDLEDSPLDLGRIRDAAREDLVAPSARHARRFRGFVRLLASAVRPFAGRVRGCLLRRHGAGGLEPFIDDRAVPDDPIAHGLARMREEDATEELVLKAREPLRCLVDPFDSIGSDDERTAIARDALDRARDETIDLLAAERLETAVEGVALLSQGVDRALDVMPRLLERAIVGEDEKARDARQILLFASIGRRDIIPRLVEPRSVDVRPDGTGRERTPAFRARSIRGRLDRKSVV